MSSDPHSVQVAYRLLQVGRPQQALDALSGAGDPDFESPFFWWIQAQARLDLDEPELAARAAREGLARTPEDVALLDLLSVAETNLGHLAEAEKAILTALEIEPDAPDLLLTYAYVVARGGQLDKAELLIDRAAQLDPSNSQLGHMRGLVAYLRGKDGAALGHAESLLAQDAEDPHAHRLRGAALVEKGRLGSAARSFTEAARDNPTDHKLADTTRLVRAARHPLLWPVWPLYRFGVVGVWMGALTIIFTLRVAGLEGAAIVASIAWVVFVIYSWTVAAFLRRLSSGGS